MFVALEGIDGAGKTSALHAAADQLRAWGHDVTAFTKQHPPTSDPYVQRHLDGLRTLIWDHPADDPYYQLGQYHWVHLVAAWFHAVSDCVVRPLLEQDRLVLVDNWIHKGLARLRLNTAIEYDYVESFFTRACLPDLVVMLDVTPQMAAARKAVFTAIEAGNLYSDIGINRTNFIRYQEGLRGQLDRFAERDGWALVPTKGCDIEQVGQGIAEAVLKALD